METLNIHQDIYTKKFSYESDIERYFVRGESVTADQNPY